MRVRINVQYIHYARFFFHAYPSISYPDLPRSGIFTFSNLQWDLGIRLISFQPRRDFGNVWRKKTEVFGKTRSMAKTNSIHMLANSETRVKLYVQPNHFWGISFNLYLTAYLAVKYTNPQMKLMSTFCEVNIPSPHRNITPVY